MLFFTQLFFVIKENKKYEDREKMTNWVSCQAIKAGFTFIIDKFDSGSGRRKLKFVLAYEGSDGYKEVVKTRRHTFKKMWMSF